MSVRTTNNERPGGLPLLPVAEGALALVTVATVACMWRLFDDASYFLPLAAHAVAAHALAASLRRRGVAPATSALACLVAALFALTWGHLRSTTSYGFPTADTLQAAADQLELAWRTFGEVRAPAPVLTGFVLSAAAAVWVGAWLADLAAFRIWTPFEALIPSGTLFLFASLFSADRARALAGALWLASALAFVLLHRTARQQTSPSWLGSDARIGTRALVKVGAGLSVVAVTIGWVVGPRLPGADAEALVPFNPDERGGSRVTISPLVEIRGRLVEQSQAELFTVTSSQRAYWRLTALDIFDGDVWSSRGSFGEAGGGLPGSGTEDDVPTVAVTQTFNILDLSTIWLPAAFEAGDISITDAEVRWDDVSSTLIVSTDYETSDGLIYQVVSDVPAFDPTELAGGDGGVPGGIAERSLELPSDFPPAVTAEAQRVVAGAATPYDQALALQGYFRGGAFTYSLDAPPGHSDSAIENFLFNTRTGYCEQFAGTYAAMARAVGLPARVAVGFTPGDADPVAPSRYIVRGEHAHAWPEVWIAGAGWVAFEPTPGRGAPGAESYTGVPESQDTAGLSTEPTTVPAPGAPTDGATDVTLPGEGTGTTLQPGEVAGGAGDLLDPEPTTSTAVQVLRALAIGIPAAVLLVILSGGTVAAARALARWRRRARASTPEALVRIALQDLGDLVVVLGVSQHRWETALEFGRRTAGLLGEPEAVRLGELVTRAEFDPAGVDEEHAADAGEIVGRLTAAIRGRTSRWSRLLAAVDPRSAPRRAQVRSHTARPAGPRIQISVVTR